MHTLNTASSINPFSPTLICNFITSPHAGAPTSPAIVEFNLLHRMVQSTEFHYLFQHLGTFYQVSQHSWGFHSGQLRSVKERHSTPIASFSLIKAPTKPSARGNARNRKRVGPTTEQIFRKEKYT
jgi:hypothetical protein